MDSTHSGKWPVAASGKCGNGLRSQTHAVNMVTTGFSRVLWCYRIAVTAIIWSTNDYTGFRSVQILTLRSNRNWSVQFCATDWPCCIPSHPTLIKVWIWDWTVKHSWNDHLPPQLPHINTHKSHFGRVWIHNLHCTVYGHDIRPNQWTVDDKHKVCIKFFHVKLINTCFRISLGCVKYNMSVLWFIHHRVSCLNLFSCHDY